MRPQPPSRTARIGVTVLGGPDEPERSAVPQPPVWAALLCIYVSAVHLMVHMPANAVLAQEGDEQIVGPWPEKVDREVGMVKFDIIRARGRRSVSSKDDDGRAWRRRSEWHVAMATAAAAAERSR